MKAHLQKLNVLDLKDIFKEYGNILKIKLHTKNSAFIEFDDKRAAKEIILRKVHYPLNMLMIYLLQQ